MPEIECAVFYLSEAPITLREPDAASILIMSSTEFQKVTVYTCQFPPSEDFAPRLTGYAKG